MRLRKDNIGVERYVRQMIVMYGEAMPNLTGNKERLINERTD